VVVILSFSVAGLRCHALHLHEQAAALLDQEVLDEAAVHDLRVLAKSLRASWQLARPLVTHDIEVRVAIRALASAARTLGAARDQHVLLETLEKLVQKSRDGSETEALREASDCLRVTSIVDTSVPVSDAILRAWREDALRWERLQTDGLAEASLAKGYARLYQKGRRLHRKARNTGDMHCWHALRKWVKYLALTLPLPTENPEASRLADRYARLGSMLGQLHDLAVLENALQDLSWSDPAMRNLAEHAVKRRTCRLLRRAGKEAERLYRQSSGDFIGHLAGNRV